MDMDRDRFAKSPNSHRRLTIQDLLQLDRDFRDQISDLRKDVDAKFANVDAKFANVDAKFANVDAKFAVVDAKFDKLHSHIDSEMKLVKWMFGVVITGVVTIMGGTIVLFIQNLFQ